MSPYRSQAEQTNDLRAENRAIEAQRAAQGIEPTPGPTLTARWWPTLAGLALTLAIVAMAWLLVVR